MIAEGVLAIEMGANATDLKLSIHPHPTLTETLMESAEVFFGQATHVYPTEALGRSRLDATDLDLRHETSHATARE